MTSYNYADVYPDKWLRPATLAGRGRVRVVVESVTLEDVFNPQSKKTDQRLIVSFVGKAARLILSRGNAGALAFAAGSADWREWGGTAICLEVMRGHNGRDGIVVSPADGPAGGGGGG
jgi:hypothetical protein